MLIGRKAQLGDRVIAYRWRHPEGRVGTITASTDTPTWVHVLFDDNQSETELVQSSILKLLNV